jgi:hypothetical protein
MEGKRAVWKHGSDQVKFTDMFPLFLLACSVAFSIQATIWAFNGDIPRATLLFVLVAILILVGKK